jgi:hypothetical protein
MWGDGLMIEFKPGHGGVYDLLGVMAVAFLAAAAAALREIWESIRQVDDDCGAILLALMGVVRLSGGMLGGWSLAMLVYAVAASSGADLSMWELPATVAGAIGGWYFLDAFRRQLVVQINERLLGLVRGFRDKK